MTPTASDTELRSCLSQVDPSPESRVVILEAAAGTARRELLAGLGEELARQDVESFFLECDLATSGPWAGVRELLRDLYPELSRHHPELVVAHDYELVMISPWLRRQVTPRNLTLTDEAMGDEKVRNYPLDRAFRLVHGAVDLIAAWRESVGGKPWVLFLENFESSGALARRFFHDLLRRRGEGLGVTLVAAVEPGTGQGVAEGIANQAGQVSVSRLDVPALEPGAPVALDPVAARARATELEALVKDDLVAKEIHFPEIVRLWLWANEPRQALRWQIFWLGITNHRGFYEDALYYCEAILEHLRTNSEEDQERRWNLVGNLFHGLTTTGRVKEALALVEQEALGKIDDPAILVRPYYVIAMLYARYLPQLDFDRAASYLERALEMLQWVDLPEDVRHFQTVFIGNGLALVRHRQGRPEEAITLCEEGFAHLEEHLAPDRHRLHRSVLLYNIAQVYAMLGNADAAAQHYTQAIEMDPNYSEYYNDRGSLYLKLDRLEEAEADYRTAVELSAPYPEVWTNLGQCLRRMGRHAEAVVAYDRALDLEPRELLALTGRARCHEIQGHGELALADYTAALAQDGNQPMLLANRAVLRYGAGQLEASVADLDAAIALAPTVAELYQNRSVALLDLGRVADAVGDLQRYLELAPDAPDRSQVKQQLAQLAPATASAS